MEFFLAVKIMQNMIISIIAIMMHILCKKHSQITVIMISKILELNMLYIGDDNTPQKIYEKLTHMISESSSDDTVMLYFAGHGMKIGTDGF